MKNVKLSKFAKPWMFSTLYAHDHCEYKQKKEANKLYKCYVLKNKFEKVNMDWVIFWAILSTTLDFCLVRKEIDLKFMDASLLPSPFGKH